MKSIIYIITIILAAAIIWSIAKKSDAPVTDTGGTASTTLADGKYAANIASSTIGWAGSKVLIPGYTDRGTLRLSSGDLTVAGGSITAGSFVIDMASLSTGSTGVGKNEGALTGHLKSADFFDVAQYPKSTFVIKSASNNADGTIAVTGDLTIKGRTVSVSIPAVIKQSDGIVTVNGTVSLDRTLWDIRYGSGKFFQNLGNNIIDDTFQVTLDVVLR